MPALFTTTVGAPSASACQGGTFVISAVGVTCTLDDVGVNTTVTVTSTATPTSAEHVRHRVAITATRVRTTSG